MKAVGNLNRVQYGEVLAHCWWINFLEFPIIYPQDIPLCYQFTARTSILEIWSINFKMRHVHKK